MKRFFKKLIYLSIPLLILGLCYIFTDPYKKIWNYKFYLSDYMMLNRGDVSTRVYLKNKDSLKYNSFIFGSSRSCAHLSREWEKYLSPQEVPFSFGSWNEPIPGIYKKLVLLDSLHSKINNAIIIIDLDGIFVRSKYLNINYDHYLISGKNKWEYYLSYFGAYIISPDLIFKSLDYKLFHKKRNYMTGFIGQKENELDPINNDWYYSDTIQIDSALYKAEKFYKRPGNQKYSSEQILDYEKAILLKIRKIFIRHNTNYKLIIAPLYDQVKINKHDLFLLDSIFNSVNIFNYSGINSITNNKYNYKSDVLHYRNKVGSEIFREIYNAN